MDKENVFLKNESEIKDYLSKYKIQNFILIPDEEYGFVVDVKSHVEIQNKFLNNFSVKFNRVYGDFNCSHNRFKSLDFMPEFVAGNCLVSSNRLVSLDGISRFIGGSLYCDNNLLKDLKGMYGMKICGFIDCANNLLESLEGAPEVVSGDFDCYNNKLKTLMYAPKKTGSFYCQNNDLTTLEHCPQEVGEQFCFYGNKINTLEFFPKVFGHYMEFDAQCLPHLSCEDINDSEFYYNAHKQELIEKNKLRLEEKMAGLNCDVIYEKNNIKI